MYKCLECSQNFNNIESFTYHKKECIFFKTLELIKNNNSLITETIYKEILNERNNWYRENYVSETTDKNLFLANFFNIHKEDVGFLIFPGKSIKNKNLEDIVNYIKHENPNKNIIGYGCSKVYKKEEISKYLNYYSFGDGFLEDISYRYGLFTQKQIQPNIKMFASAYGNKKFKNHFNDETILQIKEINATPYDTGNLYKIEKEISKYPLMGHFQAPLMIQIMLYMGIKKIYLIGNDCTITKGFNGVQYDHPILKNYPNNAGYFYEDTVSPVIPFPLYIYFWIKLHEFSKENYPTSEIISINPIGIKGLFKDIFI